MDPEDIWAPGILDEQREHRNRWAGTYSKGATPRNETGWWPDDEGEAYDAEDDLP